MSSRNRGNRITIRNLVIFTVVVVVIGWLGRGLDVLMARPSSEGLGILLWIAAPLATALLLRAFAGDGWRDLGIRPNLKGNVAWYLTALLIFPVVTVLVLIVGSGSGFITLPDSPLTTFRLLIPVLALGLLPQFFKNIMEELPWRGYLAPKVYSLHLNDFVGHLIVGIVWGIWHLPYFLFFLDRTVIQNYTTLNLAAFIPLAIVAMIAWSLVYGEIRLLTNSVWPAVLMHMVEDALLTPLLVEGHVKITPGMDWLVSPAIGVVGIIFFAATGLCLHLLRKKKKSDA